MTHETLTLAEWDARVNEIVAGLSPEEVAEVLDQVHDRLLVHGWRQGGLYGADGEACLVGGLRRVLSNLNTYRSRALFRAATEALGQEIAVKGSRLVKWYADGSIADWNDTPGRTIDEVLDLLRRVAKNLRNKEQ